MVNVDFSTPRPSTVEASVSYLLYVLTLTRASTRRAPLAWPPACPWRLLRAGVSPDLHSQARLLIGSRAPLDRHWPVGTWGHLRVMKGGAEAPAWDPREGMHTGAGVPRSTASVEMVASARVETKRGGCQTETRG